jgi:hypothetical protein
MLPSGFSEKAIKGLLVFVAECYEDLLKEMDKGIEPGQAVRKELAGIRSFLEGFRL